MKVNVVILILLISVYGCRTNRSDLNYDSRGKIIQKSKFKYDLDFLDFIQHKWSLTEYNKVDSSKFEKLKAFYAQISKGNDEILSDDYVKVPDNNILLAHYLDAKLRWNSFNQGRKKLTIEEVIEEVRNRIPERNEMLVFYYSSIFRSILNNQKEIQPFNRDINFERLEYSNQEKAIFFLCAMKYLGNQIASYSRARFPDNCFRAHLFFEKIPTFNGKAYYDFILPEFIDFDVEMDKNKPKISFKQRFIPEFDEAKSDYLRCVNDRNK